MSAPGQAAAAAAPQLTAGAHASVAPLPPFSQLMDPATAAPRWRRWISRLDHYFRATRETDGTVKRSMMLHVGGMNFSICSNTCQKKGKTMTTKQQLQP